MKKWNKKLGTSKEAQGIETEKAPQNQSKRFSLARDTRFDRAMKSGNFEIFFGKESHD